MRKLIQPRIELNKKFKVKSLFSFYQKISVFAGFDTLLHGVYYLSNTPYPTLAKGGFHLSPSFKRGLRGA
jgi:hypothetical protein